MYIKLPLVVLLAASIAACDTTESDKPKTAQRDVYNSLEDCVADWGDTELCERELKEAREHAEKMAKSTGGGNITVLPIFMGPTYYGDSRAVSHNGRTITPLTTSSARTANYTQTATGRAISYTAPNTAATSKAASSVVSRGGIGGHGVSAGG